LILAADVVYSYALGKPNYFTFFTIGPAMACIGPTGFWVDTIRVYNRTVKHIEKFGTLDKRFFTTMLGQDKWRLFTGYCQLQSMYLAAKDCGVLEKYKSLRREVPNLIPNF
jgi:hypothetical protein